MLSREPHARHLPHARRPRRTAPSQRLPPSPRSGRPAGAPLPSSAPSADDDRVTRYSYSAADQIVKQGADLPGGSSWDQTTQYIYSVRLDDKGSPVKSNNYLRAVMYPDSDDLVDSMALSNGTDTQYDRVEMTYLADGSLATRKDQRSIVLSFSYDNAGRRTEQKVTAGTVGGDQQITYAYTDAGQLDTVTSYSSIDTTISSQIKYAYNGLGQLLSEYQQHGSAVNESTSPKVQYGYDSTLSGDRYSKGRRLTHRIWPNGRKIHSVYDGHNGIDDATSRVNKLAEDNAGIPGTTIVQYQFQGDGRAVRKEYPTPQVRLDLWGGTSGTYAGLDRFGRTIDHKWASYGGSDLDRFQHGYDNVSNRLYRDNQVLPTGQDEQYLYDNWNRLTTSKRGEVDSSGVLVGTAVRQEDWTLDVLGNWSGYSTAANGTTDLDQTRSHSNANEITAITTSVGTAWATPPVSDLAGNMTSMPSGLDPTVALTASYDAWNRMIELRLASDNSLVGSYGYDGAGRRISKTTLSPNETRHYYYTSQWQIVEERVNASTNADRQYVWGLLYMDELCLRDRDTNADGTLDEHLYALQDANWNVTAVVNPGGTVVERYVYDPYGKRTILDGSWNVLTSSAYDWNIGHHGLYWDRESGLYDNRARMYHPVLGRFVQRDPLGYVDGMSVYEYVRTSPLTRLDPLGRSAALYPVPGDGLFVPGRGVFIANLARDDDLHSVIVIRFIVDRVVRAQCLCDEISFRQYYEEGYESWFNDVPPGEWTLDKADPYPHQRPWRRLSTDQDAVMDDSPGSPNGWYYTAFIQNFRSEVVCRSGKEAGMRYGTLTWGHTFDFQTSSVSRLLVDRHKAGLNTDPRVQVAIGGYVPTD